MADKHEGLLTKEDDWYDDGDQVDNFGKIDAAFPYPPSSSSAQALPTGFFVAVIGIFLLLISIMTFGGSDSLGALAVSCLICTTMILGGGLDCLLNTPFSFKSIGSGLTFKIIGLCVVVGTFVGGIVFFGWLYFNQGVYSEYRIDYHEPVATDGSVHKGVFSNGLKYYIKSNNFEEGLFSTVLAVDTGSTNEDDDQQGLAHFLEHMAFDRSFRFETRGGVYSQIMKIGADFNAFTNFRNTVYFLHKLPWSVNKLQEALFLHKNQVLYQTPTGHNIDQERGAVLGEARLHNHTTRWAVKDLICNHFGSEHRSCKRFPIGLPEKIAQFRPTDFRAYLTKWYRLDRMRLYVVGDFKGQEELVESAIRDMFANETYLVGQDPEVPSNPVPVQLSAPIEPGAVYIKEYDGLSGVDVHLMVSTDYRTPMSTQEIIRDDTYNDIFASVFKKQVIARFGQMYPEQLLQGTGITRASASVDFEWSFNSTVYSFTVTTSGKPHMSTWKRDLEVALTELKMLAQQGPDDEVVRDAMDDALSDAQSDKNKNEVREHEVVIMDLLGNLDPAFKPVSAEEEGRIVANYLGPSMTRMVSLHIQTCAQILYKSFLECVANTTYDSHPYNTYPQMRASLNVFHGRTKTKAFLRKITKDNIARIAAEVHSKPHEPVTASGLTVMFILPFVRSGRRTSNVAQDLRETDFLLNFPQDPKEIQKPYNLVDNNNVTGVHRYILGNGIGVNIRAFAPEEVVTKGLVQMQIVALGGLATAQSSLKGACQFINTVKANGLSLAKAKVKEDSKPDQNGHLITHRVDVSTSGVHHPDTHSDPEQDKESEKKTSSEGLSCEAEFMRVSVKLSSSCDDDDCDLTTKDYSRNLKYALDEMRPQYDERTVKLAYQEHEKQLDALELDLRSDDVMNREIVPQLISALFPGDVRREPVTLADLKQLDPLEVNRWAREHFVPGRFEINIAGDLNHDNMLKQVNDIFGSLPMANFSSHIDDDNVTAGMLHRVGLDPYDSEDVVHFRNRAWPGQKLRSACVLRSPTPDHGQIVHRLPAGDYLSTADRPMIRRMVDRMVSRMMFVRLRRDNGFCYHVDTVARHSILFPGYGHYEMEWVAGRYSAHQGSPEFRQDLNVVGSSLVARETLREDITEDVFAEVVATYIQRINASYSEADYWLHLMQGLSIHPPATWPAPPSDKTLPGLFDVSHTDELQGLATTTREDVNAYLRATSSDTTNYLWGIVTTRSGSYGLASGEVECPMPQHVV
eukprot:c9965_g1_i1.p1 GENE.c9965_g1_i1~~c9965_g1_i1.p1  ORF type:complete len:1260 (+),score=221.58 c9965_g1_i1:32-3781(+)